MRFFSTTGNDSSSQQKTKSSRSILGTSGAKSSTIKKATLGSDLRDRDVDNHVGNGSAFLDADGEGPVLSSADVGAEAVGDSVVTTEFRHDRRLSGN